MFPGTPYSPTAYRAVQVTNDPYSIHAFLDIEVLSGCPEEDLKSKLLYK